MHHSIEEKLHHPADFRVAYRFIPEEEGGRRSMPHQGYRPDFWYDHEGHLSSSVYMIRPEFEEDGQLILQTARPVQREGTARMWIVMPKMRAYHRQRIVPGLTGYLVEGRHRVAVATVVELMGLHTNPIE